MGDVLMRLGLYIVKLIIYLYYMDRHFFPVEILRSVCPIRHKTSQEQK